MESILHKPLPLLLASFQHYVPWKKWSSKLLYYSLVLIKFMGYTLLFTGLKLTKLIPIKDHNIHFSWKAVSETYLKPQE